MEENTTTVNIVAKHFPSLETWPDTFIQCHKNHKCESCGKLFSEARVLKKHINKFHKGHKLENFKDYKCECCGKSFPKKEDLKCHTEKSLMIILQSLNKNWNS